MWKKLAPLLILLSPSISVGLSSPTFLKSEDAFAFSVKKDEHTQLIQFNWDIAPNYYLYQKEIKVAGEHIQLGELVLPEATPYQDEFFGKVKVYRQQLTLTIPYDNVKQNALLNVAYQGCTKGLCYQQEQVALDWETIPTSEIEQIDVAPLASTLQTFYSIEKSNEVASVVGQETKQETENELLQSEQTQLAEQLATNRLSVFWFFLLGIGLAFTPCVMPMLPLLSAIVMGNKQTLSTRRALMLSISYVQGMAVTYTALGLMVAAIGLPFQIALQSPPVLIGFSILFVLLACAMFGLFDINLPNRWQQKLNLMSQKQQGGSLGSVFIMGMIAGLIASPCTSAPLSGALLYVAQSGELWIGGITLYLLALGMGIPLIGITLFGNKILPRSGNWMLNVKTAFGFVMLALPVLLISRLLPNYEWLLWSALILAFLIWLSTISQKLVWRIFLFVLFAFASKPYVDLIWQTVFETPTVVKNEDGLVFQPIETVADLERALSEHKGSVMVDLYADWCVACKEFEKYTFSSPQVKEALKDVLLLQINMTTNTSATREFMSHFQILGLPTILFFNESGEELTKWRMTGFKPAEDFLQHYYQMKRN